MNKLVSKNPVQRFKQGRKIIKALGGLPMVINTVGGVPAVRPVAGGVPSVVSKTASTAGKVGRGLLGRVGGFLGRVAGPIGAYFIASDINERRKEIADKLNSGEYTLSDGKLVKNEAASGASIGNAISDAVYRQKVIDKLLKTGNYILDKNGNLVMKPANSTNDKTSNRVTTPGRSLKTKEQWESQFNDAKNQLTSQQLMYLDSLGIDTSNAEKMQQGINAYNKDSGLVIDNKWGDKSSAALSKILSSMPANYRNEDMYQELDNKRNIPEVTPNFGYRTNNTYEDVDFRDRLKSMGIRSNADLIDFGWRTQGNDYDWKGNNWAKQFRSDINQALGGDWSDTNIRKTFNTSGNWGGGFLGSGDISDFQRALQINAGSWNGAYDRAKEQYKTNRLKFSPGYVNWRSLLNLSYYKQGGQLVSRNPVQRFKSNFRLVVQ